MKIRVTLKEYVVVIDLPDYNGFHASNAKAIFFGGNKANILLSESSRGYNQVFTVFINNEDCLVVETKQTIQYVSYNTADEIFLVNIYI